MTSKKDPLNHVKHYFKRYTEDLKESVNFYEWLVTQNLEFEGPNHIRKEAVFRIVYGGYHPLSVSGSLARGGRFNIGGAQVSSFFPNFSMKSCLYAASNLECARKEAGEFLENPEEYSLWPKKELHLWDVEFLIQKTLKYPKLKALIDGIPLAARWELQKVPKISQVLGHYLREKGKDGLIYPSTKHKGQILAFFVKDDDHVKKLFNFEKIN